MMLQSSTHAILFVLLSIQLATPPCCAHYLIVRPAPYCCDNTPTSNNQSASGSGEEEDCYTLDQALTELNSNDTLLLSPGIHTLTTFNTTGQKLDDISIIGNLSNRSEVVIRCSEGIGLVFLNVKHLTIAGITVEHCGLSTKNFKTVLEIARQKVDIIFAPLDDFSTALFLCNCWDLLVENVTIRNNTGFGLVGINLVGNATFDGTHVLSNYPATCVVSLTDYQAAGGSGGGMLIIYQDYHPANLSSFLVGDVSLRFNRALIKNNYCCRLDLFAELYNKLARSISSAPDDETIDFIGAGGLSLFLAQGHYRVDATFQSCIFENNSSTYNGAALEITQFEASNDSHVTIFDSSFLHNGGGLTEMYGKQALDPTGALLLVYYSQIPTQYSNVDVAATLLNHKPSSVEVYRTDFFGNTGVNGGGLAIFSYGPAVGFIQDEVIIENCTFIANSAEHGAAIYATEISYSGFEPGVSIYFRNLNVTNNTEILVSTGIVNINFLNVSFSGDNYFGHNRDTALSLYSSVATMSGSFMFADNIGETGGAIRLLTESYIILLDRVKIEFRHNIGIVYGGAIYVDFDTIRFNLYDCFIFFNEIDPFCSLFDTCNIPDSDQVNVKFINNSAPFGSVIYGSSFSNCPWINDSVFFFDEDLGVDQKAQQIKQNLATLEGWVNVYPPLNFNVTSIPQNKINTIAYTIDIQGDAYYDVMPGQQFTVNLSAFDQLLQPIPLTIFSRLSLFGESDLLVDEVYSSIGETDRYLLLGGREYTEVPITVFGEEDTKYIITIASSEAQVERNITVYLSKCELGFVFNRIRNYTSPDLTALSCVCAISEVISSIECNNNGNLTYPADDWIGIDENEEYIIHECIFDYCEVNVTEIRLSDPDVQCRNDRSGILCGGCKQNYSRVLGSSHCMRCDHHYEVSLVIIFAVLGILLVAFITAFNITITNGYINGFIFYANIFAVYVYDLIPLTSHNAVLVAFINLDFGIQTCFYEGMTELHLAGLKFVFPFYLGGILLIITLFAKYCRFNKFDKFLSNINVTHVFVTLLLLSYTSLVRTCIIILGYISVDTPEGGKSGRWRNDPNVFYFEGLHIALVFISIILLLFLIPFSLLLLIPRTLLGLPLTKRLKPFIDACIAPFEPNTTFWIGLRLIVRVIVYLVAILGFREYQLITISIIIVLLTFLQSFLKPFKSMGRNIVDLSLLVNLSIVSIFAIYFFPQNLQDVNHTNTLLTVFGTIFGVSLVGLCICFVIVRIPYTNRLYEGLKLRLLNGVVLLKKKASELKISACMRFMKRKLHKHGSNESVALDNIKVAEHVFTHTSVRLTESEEMTETGDNLTELRESLLSSDNIQ